MYKNSSRWTDHKITLLGNDSWKDLFTLLDKDAVDDTMWVSKNRYLEHAGYRLEIWRRLREKGFQTVITPSRTRPLLLDDLCMLAAEPVNSKHCRAKSASKACATEPSVRHSCTRSSHKYPCVLFCLPAWPRPHVSPYSVPPALRDRSNFAGFHLFV
jgi:hypothetical protein